MVHEFKFTINPMSRPARPLAAPKAQRLRSAAADAFGRDGLDGASLNQILGRAKMGKGSFYHHFADKAALHDWVTEDLSRALLAQVRPPSLETLTAATFQAELSALLERAARTTVTQPELMNLGRMFHTAADLDADRAIAKVRVTVIAWIAKALQTGRTRGVVRQDLPIELLTTWVIASLTAIDQWMLTTTTPVTLRWTAAETAIGALWQLLAVDEYSQA